MSAPWELKDSHSPRSGQGHSTLNSYNSIYTVDELRADKYGEVQYVLKA